MKKQIGIVGGGVVGMAVKAQYPEAKIFDKYRELNSWEEVSESEVIFICVPTPFDGGCDISAVEETLKKLRNDKGKIAVIKSTVVPGTTEKLQEQYPDVPLLFNPEFLDDRTAREDFVRPDKQIVGYTKASKGVANEVLEMLPIAPFSKIMTATEAEIVKYMVNTYYATKVVFANQFYDICERTGVNFDEVRAAFESDRRVAPGNFDVWHGGFRGFGGKCLPKDLESLLAQAKNMGIELPLLSAVREINNNLLKKKDL